MMGAPASTEPLEPCNVCRSLSSLQFPDDGGRIPRRSMPGVRCANWACRRCGTRAATPPPPKQKSRVLPWAAVAASIVALGILAWYGLKATGILSAHKPESPTLKRGAGEAKKKLPHRRPRPSHHPPQPARRQFLTLALPAAS